MWICKKRFIPIPLHVENGVSQIYKDQPQKVFFHFLLTLFALSPERKQQSENEFVFYVLDCWDLRFSFKRKNFMKSRSFRLLGSPRLTSRGTKLEKLKFFEKNRTEFFFFFRPWTEAHSPIFAANFFIDNTDTW